MFDKEIYIRRRQQLKEKVRSGVILLLGNDEAGMNYRDNWYPFRQDSSFLYFVGLDKANLTVIIDIDNNNEILFGNDLTVDEVVWNGYQPPLAEQADKAGMAIVKPLSFLAASINAALNNKQKVHFLPPYRNEHSEKLNGWLAIPVTQLKEAASVTLIKAIVALRSIKAPEEIKEIEKAVNITAEMQLAAMHTARVGLTEAAVAGVVHGKAISNGGNISFPIILTVNGEVLHNHYKNKVLRKGHMVLCDCGAETELHYAGDLTRTFPVDTKFSDQQREIYDIVLTAHNEAVKLLQPNIPFKDVHLSACEKLAEGLKQTGLMKGDPKDAVAAGAHALFFQCGLGHMMGLDVHDMENLGEEYVGYNDEMKKSTQFGLKSLRLAKPLEPGFVLTVEPGLYFIPELIDMWATEKKFTEFINYDKVQAYKNFGGIRVENDYLITGKGGRLLGKPFAITADEIEGIRGA